MDIVTDRSQLQVKPHLGPHVNSPTFTAFRLWQPNSLCALCTGNTIRHGVKCRTWKAICTKGILWLIFLINVIYLFFIYLFFFPLLPFFLSLIVYSYIPFLSDQPSDHWTCTSGAASFSRYAPCKTSNSCALATSVKPAVTACAVYTSACRWTAVHLLNHTKVVQAIKFVTSGTAIAGLSDRRFKAICHKSHYQLPSKEPSVIGRKS